MRTIVLGIPLPHLTYDNYSFLSAPSLFDYPRAIAEMSAVSDAVEEVIGGSQEHKTYGGLPVVNAPGSAGTFSLAELLRLRRLEAERFLGRGGVIACFAYPDAVHEGVHGLAPWRRYDWLPAPEGFSYADDLLAGHGKLGAETADTGHPFAPYVEEFGARLAFRAYLREPADGLPRHARVFARSPGGAAVGVDLAVGAGRVILLPPIASLDYGSDRGPLASVLHSCFERAIAGEPTDRPHLLRKEAS